MQRDNFTTLNPVLNFLFFITTIVMGMFFVHPIFAGCSLTAALIYYFTIKKIQGIKFAAFLIGMLLFLTAINPLFNPNGSIVLFTYFGRVYTLEALLYGASLAGMIVSMLCWFASYNAVMTSEKFIYLFSAFMPAVSLILSMILRLIPVFRKRAEQIISARQSIGMAGDSSLNRREKIRNGTVVLNTLTVWALENSVVTADSMLARGYGSGKRTSYASYKFTLRDGISAAVMTILAAAVIVCAAKGGTSAEFLPEMNIAWFGNGWMSAGHIIYTVFLLIPAAFNIKEAAAWHILRSGI